MTRVAFTLISAANWRGTGGYNYLVNLAQVLSAHAEDRVQMVLFVGTDAAAANVEPFAALSNVLVVRDAAFNDARRNRRLRQALVWGRRHPQTAFAASGALVGCDRRATGL